MHEVSTEAEFMNVQFRKGFLESSKIEVSVYNLYITSKFQAPFARGEGGIRY
jgi:hypothetical protein